MHKFVVRFLSALLFPSLCALSACGGGGGGDESSDGSGQSTLKVNLVLVGAVGGDSEVRKSLESALEIWQQIYQRAGIAIDPAWYDFDGPTELPDPRTGDSMYESISANTRSGSVNVVFGAKVDGLGSKETKFGLSGGLPGPVSPSPQSVVALSILAMTGSDGQFNLPDDQEGSTDIHNDEVRLAAEEMARLTSNYLGLENIVTFKGSQVVGQDTLSDTATCLTSTSCAYEGDARGNIMFPYPLPKIGDYPHNEKEYYPRDQITPMQEQVLKGSVLVN